jgi:fructose-1,6-bisphosphatase/inositol monophosphatase family enzyme
MTDTLHAEVPALLREAAQRFIAPRFRRLQQGDVEEKSPGELVTIVDREVEAALSPALQRLRPGSRVVGEEACTAEPTLLHGLDHGEAWLLDPLDGTGNFVAGRPEIAIMVALLREGETVAAWMLDPLQGTLHAAERGAGAWRDGQRLRAADKKAHQGLRGIVKTRYLPPGLKEQVTQRAAALSEQHSGTNCSGNDYPAVVDGLSDFVLYWRTLPWDHAPGVLFLQEAGGHAARFDGSAYRPADTANGLLVASDSRTWQAARTLLLG